MKVLLESRKRLKGIKKRDIEEKAEKILELLRSSDAELSILLTDDEDIRRINALYRNIDRPTDVIAFAMREGEFGDLHSDLLGDVVISLDRAKVQARERGVDVVEEVLFLLIHGILHLHGYDHEEGDTEREEMEAKEREILKKLSDK